MNKIDLNAIRVRVEAATGTPWEKGDHTVLCRGSDDRVTSRRNVLAFPENREFISRAPQDVLDLLDAVDDLVSEFIQMEDDLNRAAEDVVWVSLGETASERIWGIIDDYAPCRLEELGIKGGSDEQD